jgi:hypothetical protein
MKSAIAVASMVLLSACGGQNPSAPTPATSGATGLVIAGADEILSSIPSAYTASATFSDGTIRMVTPSWTTSDPAVAIVDSDGRVEGRSDGSFTLTASYAGREVSKSVQVIHNYSGHWTGQTRITSCEDTGDVKTAGQCKLVSRPGIYTLAIDIVQDWSNPREVVVPSLHLRGSVTDDGRLGLTGSIDLVDDDEVTVIAVRESRWDASLSAADAMAGHVYEDYRFIVPAGAMRAEYELTMTRAAAGTSTTR